MKILSKEGRKPAAAAYRDAQDSSGRENWPGNLNNGALAALFPQNGIRTILVPLEIGERGKALLKAASGWSQQLEARLVFLHVCRAINYVPPLATSAQFDEWNASIKADEERKFVAMKAEFDDDPFVREAGFMVVQGELEQEIVAAAREIEADLILLSTHAYHGLQHLLYGSKAEVILRHAPCAVLILPLGKAAATVSGESCVDAKQRIA